MTRVDVDALTAEYAEVHDRVERLTAELAVVTAEQNAVLEALYRETGLTQQQVADLVGITTTRLRTAVHNHWLATALTTGAAA